MPDAIDLWGKDRNTFLIERRDGAFIKSGKLLEEISSKTNMHVSRLFAIQNAAIALRKIEADPGFEAYFSGGLEKIYNNIRRDFGYRWGPATIFHFLTDCGLVVKPDVHVVRTCRHLGIWDGLAVPSSLKPASELSDRVKNLCKEKYGSNKDNSLRYLDKILMEVSRQGLLPEQPQSSAEIEICLDDRDGYGVELCIEGEAPQELSYKDSPSDLEKMFSSMLDENNSQITANGKPIQLTNFQLDKEEMRVTLVASYLFEQ
jgi:hypothetical protein